MRVRIYETNYEGDRNYLTDYVEVTEEQYKLLSTWFSMEVCRDLSYYLEQAEKMQTERDKRLEASKAAAKKREERAAKAAEAKKKKLFEKLKAEFENENHS